MKKYLCLIMVLFLLTGCDIEYNLKIDGNSYTEDINVVTPNTDSWKSIVENASKVKQISYISEVSNEKHYYDLVNYSKNSNKLNYTYKYDEKTIVSSSAINDCYKYVTMDTSNGYIDFKTNPSLSCWYRDGVPVIDSLTVNITTPLKVVSNNADKIDGNTYTWLIDENSIDNKPIEIKMEKPAAKSSANSYFIYIVLALAAVIIIGYFVYLFIRNKHEKTNQI